MLCVHVCSPPPWPSGACTMLPAAPRLPLPGACPFCFSIASLLSIVVSRLRRRAGSKGLAPRSVSVLVSEPLPPPSRTPAASEAPAPASLSTTADWQFWGRILLAFSFVKGWLVLGVCHFPGFVWFSFLQASRRCTSSPHLSFSCSLLLHRCHTLAVLTSPIPPYNKVCTSHTPAASQGLHYITVGLLLLLPSLPGNRHRPLPATIHTVT